MNYSGPRSSQQVLDQHCSDNKLCCLLHSNKCHRCTASQVHLLFQYRLATIISVCLHIGDATTYGASSTELQAVWALPTCICATFSPLYIVSSVFAKTIRLADIRIYPSGVIGATAHGHGTGNLIAWLKRKVGHLRTVGIITKRCDRLYIEDDCNDRREDEGPHD